MASACRSATPDLRERRRTGRAVRGRVLDGEQRRAAPLAADGEALAEPQQGRAGSGRATPIVAYVGSSADQDGRRRPSPAG